MFELVPAWSERSLECSIRTLPVGSGTPLGYTQGVGHLSSFNSEGFPCLCRTTVLKVKNPDFKILVQGQLCLMMKYPKPALSE